MKTLLKIGDKTQVEGGGLIPPTNKERRGNEIIDVKCKVLEWLSRGAHKTAPYISKRKNDEFHEFMLIGINEFLKTDFTIDDMDIIYTYLGNACNHEKTVAFINSGYDMKTLTEKKERR